MKEQWETSEDIERDLNAVEQSVKDELEEDNAEHFTDRPELLKRLKQLTYELELGL